MSPQLVGYVQRNFPETKGDLGYSMWDRCYRLSHSGGTLALISLQHWLSLVSYEIPTTRSVFKNYQYALSLR